MASGEQGLRYENDNVFLEVNFDNGQSYELGVEIGKRHTQYPGPPFSLAEILRLRGVEDATFVSGLMISNESRLPGILARLTRLTLDHGCASRWVTLALTGPQADADWVAEFARGFFTLAERFQIELIGGDTTRGPLCVSVQILGTVPRGQGLLRADARVGEGNHRVTATAIDDTPGTTSLKAPV